MSCECCLTPSAILGLGMYDVESYYGSSVKSVCGFRAFTDSGGGEPVLFATRTSYMLHDQNFDYTQTMYEGTMSTVGNYKKEDVVHLTYFYDEAGGLCAFSVATHCVTQTGGMTTTSSDSSGTTVYKSVETQITPCIAGVTEDCYANDEVMWCGAFPSAGCNDYTSEFTDTSPPLTETVRHYRSTTINTCRPESGAVGKHVVVSELKEELSEPVALPDWGEVRGAAIAALPPDPNNGAIRASLYHTNGFFFMGFSRTVMVVRVTFRLVHPPTPTCYLKVWLRRRFVPRYDALGFVEPLGVYEWSPTTDPCLAHPELPPTHVDNLVVSTERYVLEPPTKEGWVDMEVVKYSFLSGYEPDDPLPDGSRPSPDLMPNGFPAL